MSFPQIVEKVILHVAFFVGSCSHEDLRMKFTTNTLAKIEDIVEESGYVIRYERGNFQSGYCILQDKKVVVLNKFLQTEGRINTIIDLLSILDINFDKLTLESQKLYNEVSRMAQAG